MNGSRLDLNLLVSLDVLLAEGNVTRAAKRLGLSQPALSAQLKQLRDSFGDPLLLPGARGMTPTSRGDALREPLREVLAQIQALTAGARTFDPATAEQTFRIVASDAIHHTAGALLAARLGTLAPRCKIALLPYDGARTQEQMATGESDLWLGARASMPPNLRARPLYEEHFLCVVRRDHPLAARPLDLDRFCALEHVLVSPTGGGFRGTVDESLAGLERSRRVTVSLNKLPAGTRGHCQKRSHRHRTRPSRPRLGPGAQCARAPVRNRHVHRHDGLARPGAYRPGSGLVATAVEHPGRGESIRAAHDGRFSPTRRSA